MMQGQRPSLRLVRRQFGTFTSLRRNSSVHASWLPTRSEPDRVTCEARAASGAAFKDAVGGHFSARRMAARATITTPYPTALHCTILHCTAWHSTALYHGRFRHARRQWPQCAAIDVAAHPLHASREDNCQRTGYSACCTIENSMELSEPGKGLRLDLDGMHAWEYPPVVGSKAGANMSTVLTESDLPRARFLITASCDML